MKQKIQHRALTFVALMITAAGFILCSKINDVRTAVAANPFEITFTAQGYSFKGEFYRPANASNPPVAILINHFGNSPARVEALKQNLLSHGFAALIYNMPGKMRLPNWGLAAASVTGAIAFAKNEPSVNHNEIFLIGASVGADIMASAGAQNPKISGVVALSPRPLWFLGPNESPSKMDQANIFVVSDDRDANDAKALFNASKGHKQIKIYPGYGHGGQLLLHADVQRDIAEFLQSLAGRRTVLGISAKRQLN